jgi:hypothetical protein
MPQAFFFVSFILIESVMLLNVVVAVLLDEFVATVTRAKEAQERFEAEEQDKRKVKGVLDQLTKNLEAFEDRDDLFRKINGLYDALDEDGSGGLNFEEFQQGLMNMISTLHLTRDDFDVITENGKFLGANSEFNSQQFQEMMKGELWRYSRRQINNVLMVTGDEHFRSLFLMLKMMEFHTNNSFDSIASSLASISRRLDSQECRQAHSFAPGSSPRPPPALRGGRQRQVMKEESGDKEESIREMAAELERPKGSERELAVRLVGAENDRKQAEKSVDQASQVEETLRFEEDYAAKGSIAWVDQNGEAGKTSAYCLQCTRGFVGGAYTHTRSGLSLLGSG